MTKIKLCGLRRACDIEYANRLMPEYIGFVFARNSKRYAAPELVKILKEQLNPAIVSVGVFVNEEIPRLCQWAEEGFIDMIQLHGSEDADYIQALKKKTDCPIIQAFKIETGQDLIPAEQSPADYILLDSGGGTGETFDWSLLHQVKRPYFLAGGLTPGNVKEAIQQFHPFAVDASSSLETDGWKDFEKVTAFVNAVRTGEDNNYGR